MNIFLLDPDPRLAAEYHCDKHVVSQIKETAHILSTVVRATDTIDVPVNSPLYQSTHYKHPVVQWVLSSDIAFKWTHALGYWLSMQYLFRYGIEKRKSHKSTAVIRECGRLKGLPWVGDGVNYQTLESIECCRCMPAKYRSESADPEVSADLCSVADTVEGYRRYYLDAKGHLLKYGGRRTLPEWSNVAAM